MASERTGKFGTYYGSTFSESSVLPTAQMQHNAKYIYAYLILEGWSTNAICALLGNMQAESGINPGRWQSDNVGNTSAGYGLVQWTPASNYIAWCGDEDPSTMDQNLSRIIYELENGLQWYATSSYNFSFKTFSKSTESVEYLAKAFLLNYERPADQSESVQNKRASNARSWYTYLSGTDPDTPSTPGTSTTKKRKGYNFVLFNRRRRMQQWQQWTKRRF